MIIDPIREERITMEIIVDAYDEYEQAMGWYYYLEEQMQFPFTGMYAIGRGSLLVNEGETMTVIGIASEAECKAEIFINIKWKDDILAIPLTQIEAFQATDKTQQAVDDWHYWVDQGYSFDADYDGDTYDDENNDW